MSLARPHGRLLGCVLAAAAAFSLASATPALATSIGEKIILRCTHGESLAGFSQSAYDQALKELLADTEEYSGCSQEIRQAQIAAAGSHGAGGPGSAQSGSAPVALPASAADLSSLAHAKSEGSGPVQVGGEVVSPGVVHADVASAFSTLPAPLLAVLALMLASLIVLIASLVRKRVRDGRPD